MIQPQAELERGVPGLDVVLDVGGLLLDRAACAEGERRAAARQIERQQVGLKSGFGGQRSAALAGIVGSAASSRRAAARRRGRAN